MLCKLKKIYRLTDVFRKIHPDKTMYTYIDPSNRGRNSRIDFFLCTDNITSRAKIANIICAPTPDHKAVDLGISLTQNTRGKGYWKMNTSVLNDELYRLGMESVIAETFDDYSDYLDKIRLWEFLKTRIKNFTIDYCIMKARNNKDEAISLENRLNKIDSILVNKDDNDLQSERKQCKQALDELYFNKAKGYQIRSRAQWIELGEKSTGYFLGLEKSRQSDNTIRSLKDENGNVKVDDNDILFEAHKFYSELYKTEQSPNVDVDNYIEDLKLVHILREPDKIVCEGDISYNECESAVKSMKGNKSPGLDGICIEFYQVFWPYIGHLLVDVFNQCFHDGILSKSQRVAVMSLIFKKDDREDISNYRPISLTNNDYRILAFILAHRLQTVIGTIIDNDQTAYIKSRYMGYNIRLANDIIEYYNTVNKSGIMLSIDF